MATLKSFGGIIHRIADCMECGWHDEDPRQAPQRARRHTEKTGHETNVETGSYIKYTKEIK